MANHIIKSEVKDLEGAGGSWEEEWEYDIEGKPTKAEFEILAHGVIENYNNTLRINERPRKLVRIIDVMIKKGDGYVKLYEWSLDT